MKRDLCAETAARIHAAPERGAAQGELRSAAPKDPLYDIDWINGRSIEVFYADQKMAGLFGSVAGWYWWECYPGCLPESDAFGPFPTSYCAYRDAVTSRADAGDIEQNRRGTPPAVSTFSPTRRLRRAARR